MKYILHYVNKMNRGGMETYIMNIYREIDRSKYQFHFIVHTEEHSDYDDEIRHLGGKIIVFPKFKSNPIKYRKKWNDFWKKNKNFYHAFHYHNNYLANIQSIKSAINNNFRNIIVHAHSSYANRGKLQKINDFIHKRNQKYLIKKDIMSIAVSNEAAQWVFGIQAINDEKVKIVNNGIYYDQFKFDNNIRQEKRQELGLDDEYVIGHVGNLNPVKNHKFLFNIFTKILKVNKNFKLLLLGDGPLKEELVLYAQKLDIQEKVVFQGNVPNVEDYLNSMDVFVFPSLYEGLGLSIIEAQINGLPVIYSNTIPQDVEITKNCFPLSLDEDYNIWKDKVLSSKDLRNKNKHLNMKFEITNAVKEIVKVYNQF